MSIRLRAFIIQLQKVLKFLGLWQIFYRITMGLHTWSSELGFEPLRVQWSMKDILVLTLIYGVLLKIKSNHIICAHNSASHCTRHKLNRFRLMSPTSPKRKFSFITDDINLQQVVKLLWKTKRYLWTEMDTKKSLLSRHLLWEEEPDDEAM